MDNLDHRILDRMQSEFPLSRQPWREMAQALEMDEAELLGRIKALKEQGFIRRIGGIMNSRQIGYQACLCAAKITEERIESAAKTINLHPGVTHNYQRDHEYNLWFTLTLRSEAEMQEQLAEWERQLNLSILRFPVLKTYKIRVILPMADKSGDDRTMRAPISGHELDSPPDGGAEPNGSVADAVGSWNSDYDQAIYIYLQEDLPLHSNPYQMLADKLQVSTEDIVQRIQELQGEGKIRRLAAILRHQQAGYGANAMVVWRAALSEIDRCGEAMAGHPAVSHCYWRAGLEQFPWPLYTMVHARSEEKLAEIVKELEGLSELSEYQIIRSVREFKKSSLRFDL